MEEFILFMRMDIITKDAQPSPEQMEIYMKQYQDWVGSIAAQNRFVGGKGLSTEGRVTRKSGVTDGPFVEIKESVAGFVIIRAENLEEATKIAMANPMMNGDDTSIEVRQVMRVS